MALDFGQMRRHKDTSAAFCCRYITVNEIRGLIDLIAGI
jgi:hypothetical protein